MRDLEGFQQLINRLEGGNDIIRTNNNIIKLSDQATFSLEGISATILKNEEYVSNLPLCLDFLPSPQSEFISVEEDQWIFPVLPEMSEVSLSVLVGLIYSHKI